jgi:hypothetical protein
VSNELTEAERAARAAMIANPMGCWCTGDPCHECLNAAAAVVAAVRSIIEAEITGQRAECPDLFCMGWKDSGICPNEPLYRHSP